MRNFVAIGFIFCLFTDFRGIENIADVISSYKELAEGFFKAASHVRFGAQLNELSHSTKHLYEGDYLQ